LFVVVLFKFWFEGQEETMKILGVAGVMNSTSWIKLNIATSVKTVGFKCGFNFWFHRENPLIILIQTDVTNKYHALNQDIAEHVI